MVLLSSLLFIFGLFFGSFLLVIIDRLPKRQSPFSGRSHCEHCNHTLAWYDLVPVLSFFSLRGKCRYCHKELSLYYPVTELLTGCLFAFVPSLLLAQSSFVPVSSGFFIEVLFALFIVSIFIIIFLTDLRSGIIPFAVIIPAFVITALSILFREPTSFLNHLVSAVGAGLFFFLIYYFTKGRGMGFGDVVLAFFLGMLLGFPAIVSSLYLAFLTGAAISLILIVTGKKKLKGSTIPFGPFLILGAYISFFWGEQIARYVSGVLFH